VGTFGHWNLGVRCSDQNARSQGASRG
jgi:hypothetical protein